MIVTSHSRRMFGVAIAALTLLSAARCVAPVLVVHAEPNFAELSASVLRVDATNCEGNPRLERHASGFVYRDRASAVTAMHVVADCENLSVYYQNAKVARKAAVIHRDSDADLVLLAITDPPDVKPLLTDPHVPGLSDPLQVLGFPLQIPSMSSTSLHLRFGGQTLKEIVPETVRTSLAQNGSPSLDLSITNIEGHLVPGLSGAPIFNGSSRVVAVGDGGLENGAVGISWGVPAAALAHLLVANDAAPQPHFHRRQPGGQPGSSAAAGGNLFAAESEAADLGTVTCSGLSLTKLRTVTFPQIAASTDDMQGLGFIAGYFSIDPSSYQFDVYQNLASGASIVLPAGAVLSPDGTKGCIARTDNGNVTLRVEAGHGASLSQLQLQSQKFELDAVGGSANNWFPDSTFTYPAPHPRFDNLLVRRRAWTHGTMGINGMVQDAYLFETFAGRGDLLLGTSALNTGITPAQAQGWNLCRSNPAMQGCDAMRASAQAWVSAVLAVHLTTFPIG